MASSLIDNTLLDKHFTFRVLLSNIYGSCERIAVAIFTGFLPVILPVDMPIHFS